MRVLIGTDGSDEAVSAARAGLELLAPPDSLVVVCVVEAPAAATAGLESGFAGGMATDSQVERAWQLVEEEAEDVLDRTVAALEPSAEVERVVTAGEAGPVLCRLAEERDADAIVVGSRGRGAIKRALLGSVSSHVSNNAPCPVVIVRSGVDG